MDTTGDAITLLAANVIWCIHWNAKWSAISKYQTSNIEHVTVADRKSLEQLRQCLIKDGVSSLKMAVKNYCFLVKRLELGYVLYIIKHATKTDKDVFTKLLRTWKIYKVMRNQQCIFFLYLTDLLIFWLPKLKSLYLKKKVRKTFGKQTFILAVKW